MGIKIREAKLEDVGVIVNLNQKLFNYEYGNFDKTLDCSWPPRNEDYFREAIESKSSIVLTAVLNGKVVGYLVGSIHKAEDYRKVKELVEIDNTFIIEEQRGKGVGKKLFDKFLEWAKKKGMGKMKVVASSKNEKAISFYRKCGFSDYNLILEGDIVK